MGYASDISSTFLFVHESLPSSLEYECVGDGVFTGKTWRHNRMPPFLLVR